MRANRLFFFSVVLLALKTNGQTCTAGFIYSLSPNGNITFSNTSVPVSPTVATVYVWNTGNGQTFTTTSLSQTVSTTYASNGQHTATLSVTSATPYCSANASQNIFVSIAGCNLHALSSCLSSPSNPTVNFTSVSTGTTANTTYTWNFGDGTSSNVMNPVHTYSANGIFGYTLMARNNATCSSIVGAAPWQAGNGCTYICNYTPTISYTTAPGGMVTFTAHRVGSTLGFCQWSYGDSLNSPTFAPNPTHLYFNGAYTPSVYISVGTSSACGPYTLSTAVTITDNPCLANAAFTYTAGSGGVVQFAKSAPPNPNISYLWTFGDGVMSSSSSPTHTYSSAGNYSVTLFSYHNSFPLYFPGYSWTYTNIRCKAINVTNLNITGVPCNADAGFSFNPSAGYPGTYYITPFYPYNVATARWSWGDGTSSSQLYASHVYAAPGNYSICLTVTTTCGATASACVTRYLSAGTTTNTISINTYEPQLTNSIGENSAEEITMTLFPNPGDGRLNIRLGKAISVEEAAVYDLFGKKVYALVSPQTTDALEVDVSFLENGIYFLQLRSTQKSQTQKFIISR